MSSLFTQISVVIVLAAILGLIAKFLRQPTMLGYLLTGLIIGPLGYLHFDQIEIIDAFAEIGIALLLFMVGLELNVRELRQVGKPALIAGLAQVSLTIGGGYLISRLLGFDLIPSLYMAVGITFSSTIIIIKLLAEKSDLDSLYGKLVVGILLVQDIVAILMLIFLSGSENANILSGSIDKFVQLAIMAVIVVTGVFVASKKIFPLLLDKIGRSQEMLFIFSIAWGLGFAALMSSKTVGFSLEMGGLLAGLALANSAEHFQIAGRIRPLRDFFVVLFFVVLGSKMVFVDPGSILVPSIVISAFVLFVKPVIMAVIMAIIGYRPRTSFLVSLTTAQVSEFSMILFMLGQKLGHIEASQVSTLTFVSVITMIGSSYFIWNGNDLYRKIETYLAKVWPRSSSAEHIADMGELENHIVLVGAHRTGSNILNALIEQGSRFVVVDFNPTIVHKLQRHGIPVIYGDISDSEIQERARLDRARLVISTTPDLFDASALLEYMKKNNHSAHVIVTAESDWEGLKLYNEGADYVLLPHFLGGQQLASILRQDHDFKGLHRLKLGDLKLIRQNIIT